MDVRLFFVTLCVISQIATWSANGLKLPLSNITTKSSPTKSPLSSLSTPSPSSISQKNKIPPQSSPETKLTSFKNYNNGLDPTALELILAQSLLNSPSNPEVIPFLKPSPIPNLKTLSSNKDSVVPFPIVKSTNGANLPLGINSNINNFTPLPNLVPSSGSTDSVVSLPFNNINNFNVPSSFTPNAFNLNPTKLSTLDNNMSAPKSLTSSPNFLYPGLSSTILDKSSQTLSNIAIPSPNIVRNPAKIIDNVNTVGSLDVSTQSAVTNNPNLNLDNLKSSIPVKKPSQVPFAQACPGLSAVPATTLSSNSFLPVKANPLLTNPKTLSVNVPSYISKPVIPLINSSSLLVPSAPSSTKINNFQSPIENKPSVITPLERIPLSSLPLSSYSTSSIPQVSIPKVNPSSLPIDIYSLNKIIKSDAPTVVAPVTINNPDVFYYDKNFNQNNFIQTSLHDDKSLSDLDSILKANSLLTLSNIDEKVNNNLIINFESLPDININILQNNILKPKTSSKNLESLQIAPPKIPTLSNLNQNIESPILNSFSSQNNILTINDLRRPLNNLNVDLDSESLAAILNQIRNPVTIKNNANIISKDSVLYNNNLLSPVITPLVNPPYIPSILSGSNYLERMVPTIQPSFLTSPNINPLLQNSFENEGFTRLLPTEPVEMKKDRNFLNPITINPSIVNINNDIQMVFPTNDNGKSNAINILPDNPFNILPFSGNILPNINLPKPTKIDYIPNLTSLPNVQVTNLPFKPIESNLISSKFDNIPYSLNSKETFQAVNKNPFKGSKDSTDKDVIYIYPSNINSPTSAVNLDTFLNINDIIESSIPPSNLLLTPISSLPNPTINLTKINRLESLRPDLSLTSQLNVNPIVKDITISNFPIISTIPYSITSLPTINIPPSTTFNPSVQSSPKVLTPEIIPVPLTVQSNPPLAPICTSFVIPSSTTYAQPAFVSQISLPASLPVPTNPTLIPSSVKVIPKQQILLNIPQTQPNTLVRSPISLSPTSTTILSKDALPIAPVTTLYTTPSVSNLPKVNAPKYVVPQSAVNYANVSPSTIKVPKLDKLTSDITKPINNLANEVMKKYVELVAKKLNSKPATSVTNAVPISNPYLLRTESPLQTTSIFQSTITSPPAIISSNCECNNLPSYIPEVSFVSSPPQYLPMASPPLVTSASPIASSYTDNIFLSPFISPIQETTYYDQQTTIPYFSSFAINSVPFGETIPEVYVPTYIPSAEYYLPNPINYPTVPYPPYLPFPSLLPTILETPIKSCSPDFRRLLEVLVLTELLDNDDCNNFDNLDTIIALLCAT